MSKTMMYAAVLLAGVFISAIAQVMLKKAAMKTYSSVIAEYLNAPVIIAYMIFFGSTFCSIIAYKGIPLSMGPVLEATSYIYITLFGKFIFKEDISRKKLLSLILIVSGIIVYSLG